MWPTHSIPIGGSFASQPPGGAALQNPSGAPGSSLAIVPPSSCDDCDDYDDVVSEATQPPSPYHQAQLRPGHPSGGSPMATHHAAAPPFGQGPSSSGGGGGGGGQYGTRGAFLRGASTESAATVDHAAAGAAPYGAPQGLPPAREKRETVLSLRVVEGGGGDDDGDGVHECLGKLSVGLPVRRDDASSLPGLNGAGQPSLLQPRDGAPPLPQMARSLSDPTAQSRHLRPQDVLDTLSGRSVPDLDPHLCGVLHDARDGRAPPPRAPRSPPKIEELCGGDTTPKDLQNVVDGLMLIANAGARR